ncbi:type II toxin-antitoxin system VapC family toxin [bacterium]|nr:type II toxin-antitoxin system VapC family toxin [bacterium]
MTGDFVLDTSVTISWCFNDEANSYADAVLDSLSNQSALAPGIWPLEVGNVLLVAEKKARISPPDSLLFLSLLTSLPIHVENLTEQRILDAVFLLAREQGLSSYDAAYLDLAIQTGLQIATLDQSLQKAAARKGVGLYMADSI